MRQDVIKDVMTPESIIKAVVADKSNAPKQGSKTYKQTAKLLIDDVMIKGGICVVFGETTNLSINATTLVVQTAAEKHSIKLITPTTRKSSNSPELQAIDFPTGAIGARYNIDRKTDLRNSKDY